MPLFKADRFNSWGTLAVELHDRSGDSLQGSRCVRLQVLRDTTRSVRKNLRSLSVDAATYAKADLFLVVAAMAG